MSTRTRQSRQSYTARLHQRSAATRRRGPAPRWSAGPLGPALLALAAELGHLAAALVEWPASTPRGIVHIVAAVVLGLVAAGVYFGPSWPVLPAGIAVGAILPTASLLAVPAGASPYQDYPPAAALAVAGFEVALTVSLIWRAAR